MLVTTFWRCLTRRRLTLRFIRSLSPSLRHIHDDDFDQLKAFISLISTTRMSTVQISRHPI